MPFPELCRRQGVKVKVRRVLGLLPPPGCVPGVFPLQREEQSCPSVGSGAGTQDGF